MDRSSGPSEDTEERRRLLVAGGVFFGALVALIALVVVFAGDAGDPQPTTSTQACAPGDVACRAAQQSAERPGVIPRPGEGQAPDEPGDRGGWEQIAVLVLIVGALGVIGVLVWRGTRRARSRAET